MEKAAEADRAKHDELAKTNHGLGEEKRNLTLACNEKDRQFAETQTRHEDQMAEMGRANADLETANQKLGREARKGKTDTRALEEQIKELKKQIKDISTKLRGSISKIASLEEHLADERIAKDRLQKKTKKQQNELHERAKKLQDEKNKLQIEMHETSKHHQNEMDEQAAEHDRSTRKLKDQLAKIKKTLAKRSEVMEEDDELHSRRKANNLHLPEVFSPSPLNTSSQEPSEEPSEDDDLHDFAGEPRQMQTVGTH